MTNQEAIEHIKNIKIYSYQDGYTDEAREALDMAIKALEAQELSNNSPKLDSEFGDLISRQAAIDALRVAYWDNNIQSAKDDPCIVDAMTDWAIRQVKALPPAQPEHDENDLDFMQPHKRIPVQLVVSSDCINRQAAIDALDVLCQEHRYRIPGKRETYSQYNEAWQDALDRAEGAIGNLPSAQPYTEAELQKMQDLYQAEIDKAFELGQEDARSEIIHCGECKHRDPEYHKCDCGHDILWQLPRDDKWYCADAERRTE